MTVEQQVDALTASVEDLKAAVISKKATLDASVADAQSATAQAQSAKENALSARNQAEAFKDAAYTAAQSAASALAYQDLSAVALTKAVTAVDLFIYDTSKDSDGGAWRHRCAGTSWYREPLNTATRGARREFPAVAVIVAESNKVTIYDGDDPTLPMWMVFEGSWSYSTGKMLVLASTDQAPIRAISMRNAVLTVGTFHSSVSGLHIIDFVKERGRLAQASGSGYNGYTNHPNIAKRNAGLGISVGNTLGSIVNSGVNDVAMTVLPKAPIDHATGLPVPTIAVATAGGVSVIKDDGNIWDITGTNWGGSSNGLIFDRGTLYFIQASYYWLACDVAGLSQDYVLPDGYQASNDNYPFQRVNLSESIAYATALRRVAAGGSSFDLAHPAATVYPGTRLVYHKRGVAGGPNLVAYTTSSYNTGWLPGVIRGAFLADTDDADLVASEVMTNGTFDIDATGWSATGGAGLSTVDGKLKINNDVANFGGTTQTIATVPGRAYILTAEIEISNTAVTFRARNEPNLAVLSTQIVSATGAYELHFVAISTATQVQIINADGTLGDFSLADNISVRPADADRSADNRGLLVNGTVTRAPVVTGAELLGYTCDSASYLSRDFAGDLNGQSTFALIFWAKGNRSSQGFRWFETPGGGTSTAFLNLYFDANIGQPRFVWQGRTSLNVGGDCPPHDGQWALHVAIFQGGSFKHYQNGDLQSSSSHGITAQLHELRISPVTTAAMALFRITNSIPTADQIHRIYEDEKVLFQENAACTVFGTSDVVTALAHDPDTGLLHVGTSTGRSVFRGLRRVANTTIPVGVAIAAAGGMVVEE